MQYLNRARRAAAFVLLAFAGAHAVAAPITPTDLALWAQSTFPSLFRGSTLYGTIGPYSYRYYTGSGNYIGFSGNDIYVYGPLNGYGVQRVGSLADFTCIVDAARCATAAVRAENDDFATPAIDTCRWFDWHQSGGTSAQGSGLRLTTSAAAGTFSTARRVSQYMVKGDADLQVTVQALSGFDAVPATAQLYASFGLWADDNNRILVQLAKAGAQTVVRALRVTSTNGTPQFQNFDSTPVSAASVRLRVLQAGTTAQLQYDAGAGWQTAATVPAFASDAYVELTASAVGVARDFTARFDNFTIASGATSWRKYVRGDTVRRRDVMAGITGGDAMNTRFWGSRWGSVNPFTVLKANGVNWYASDVRYARSSLLASTPVTGWSSLGWHDEFWRSRELVAESLKQASAAGMRLYVQLLLSDDAAYFGRQRSPWPGLSVAETADRLRTATAQIVSDYKSRGLNVEVYSIGNEIDIGVLDFLPGNRIATVAGVSSIDVNYLRTNVWPTEATLLKAAIEGVKSVDPNAKILVHVAGLPFSMASPACSTPTSPPRPRCRSSAKALW